MFDMLDDDLDIGYVPTIASNSRAGNMKKLAKKQPKAQAQPAASKNNKSNDFDDLLDDFIDLDPKKPAKSLDNKTTAPKNMYNSLDSQFDDPKPLSLQKPKQNQKQSQPLSLNNPSKPSFMKFGHDEIINQDPVITSFGRIQQTSNNTSKVEQSYVSTRNMKPPLRKKNEGSTENLSLGFGSLSLNVPEDNSPKLNVFSKKIEQDDEIIRPPPRLMNRRSSMDGKNDKMQQSLSLTKNQQNQSPKNTISFEIKPEQIKPKENLRLSLDEPKPEPVPVKHEEFNSFKLKIPQKQLKKPEVQIKKTEKIVPKQEAPKKFQDYSVDQSITIVRDSPSHPSNKATIQDYEKQIQQIKMTFQKQIDFLQDSLERQISINRQTRQKVIRQSNKMIEDQRQRSKKIQQEQIKRMKQMFEWQKQRSQQSYRTQIQNLRKSLQYAQKTNNYSIKPSSRTKEDIDYLQNQLRNQKRLLQDRQKILQRREQDFSDRQNQVNKRIRREQQRLRQQQKRIIQSQVKLKKILIQQRKAISQEKQQMAIELANLQIQAIKKKEKVQHNIHQLHVDKQGIQQERYQLRNQNAELMARYKAKVEEVQRDKARIKLIESDLIKKLKIVQQKLKESNQASVNQTMYNKKENNWIEDRQKSHQNIRSFSIQKREGNNKLSSANFTKQRFNQLQNNTKNKMNISVKQNKKFDLDNYMMTVQQYKKLKAYS